MHPINNDLHNILFVKGLYSDISFKINGVDYHLHKYILSSGSLFFKALLDNEKYIGLKNDEITINYINETAIRSECVKEILAWLYHNNINMMENFINITRDAEYESVDEIVQYSVLIDFFQIDGLKKIYSNRFFNNRKADRCAYATKIKEYAKSLCKSMPQKDKRRYGWEFNICGRFHCMSENFKEKEVNELLDDICKGLAYIKCFQPKYFNKCVQNIKHGKCVKMSCCTEDSGNTDKIELHILKNLCDLDPPYGGGFRYVSPIRFNNEKKLCCRIFSCESDLCAVKQFDSVPKYMYDILKYMLSETFINSVKYIPRKNMCISAKYFEILMNTVDDKCSLIELLDCDDLLDNKNFQMLKQVCHFYGLEDELSNKINALHLFY